MDYRNHEKVVNRLLKDYREHDNDLIIGVDFDNTIFDLDDEGNDMMPVVNLLKRCNKLGLTLCLWTALTDDWSLTYKKFMVKLLGLEFKYFNASPAMNDSRKPHFSILLDDRAGLASSFKALEEVVTKLEQTP